MMTTRKLEIETTKMILLSKCDPLKTIYHFYFSFLAHLTLLTHLRAHAPFSVALILRMEI